MKRISVGSPTFSSNHLSLFWLKFEKKIDSAAEFVCQSKYLTENGQCLNNVIWDKGERKCPAKA